MYKLEKTEKILGFIFVFSYFTFSPYLFSYLFAFLVSKLSLDIPYEMVDAWFNLFYDGAMLLIGLCIFRHFIFKNIKQRKSGFLKAVGSGFLLLYAMNFIVSLMMMYLAPETSSQNQAAIEVMTTYAPTQIFVSSVIFAPILEELVFRVGIFQSIYEKHQGLAYFMSSFLFGFVHISQGLFGGDLSQLLYLPSYALLGATFAYMYEKNKNIFVPMTVHMLNNFISIVIMFG